MPGTHSARVVGNSPYKPAYRYLSWFTRR